MRKYINKFFALCLPGGTCIEHPRSLPDYTLNGIIQTFITYLLIFAALYALIMLIWSGIQWITSNGEKQKTEAAKDRITYEIIGLILIFLSFAIVNIIKSFFGLS